MADHTATGFGKDPFATSHGDALADQSFQSLKSKEVRDSLSPTEMKFQSMALNNPNTTGWNVQSSKEVSPDGRGFRAETLATTDGIENINGGIAEFKGRNEQLSSAHQEGDDKNFIKKAMESSKSHLQEKVVLGDENSGRTEVRTSSSTSTSSSQVIQSSTNVEYDDGFPGPQAKPQKFLMDSKIQNNQDLQKRQQQEQQRLLEEQRIYEQQFQKQSQEYHNQQERRSTEHVSTTRQNKEQKNISQNVQTQETHEQNKRYVDMDKASPEYQQHVQHLMQQPGEIISNTVEYPKPNVKMITTVKRLPDGTIVRNKRYETEECPPTASSTTRSPLNAPNQTQPRHDNQQQPIRNYKPDTHPHSRPSHDMVDSSSRYVKDTHTDDVETEFASIKKSSRKFSTETTSETIQEINEHHPYINEEPSTRCKPTSNDFSTHGFPSVKAHKPTQEYPSERPHATHPTQAFPGQASPTKPSEAVVPRYIDATDNIIERRIPTKDGEVIIVSSERKQNYKTSTNSERIEETEHIVRDDKPYQRIPDKSQDFTTHGFPSVREPNDQQPHSKQTQQNEPDFPLDNFSPGRRIIKKSSPHGDDDVIVVSSQRSHTAKHSTNSERIIKHEVIKDDNPVGYPQRIQTNIDKSPYNYTVTTPGEQTPQGELPASPRKLYVGTPDQTIAPGYQEPHDYTSQEFPSVKTPSRPAAGLPSSYNQHPNSSRKPPSQDFSTHGFPSVRSPTKDTPNQGYPSRVDAGKSSGTVEQLRPTPTKTQRTPSPTKSKAPNKTVRETTERVIRKEKELDLAHRAFAASLRSSSPIDHVRRDSYTTDSHSRRTPPRSSVSSTRTFRRDMREGSHDSAPSETSRISTTTSTRNTPPRTVGGRTVVTKVVSTKIGQGSNDTINMTSPRATKSPSPGKTITTTTTTTTRTLTDKDVPRATDNQPTSITTNNFDSIFPINVPPLTTITKNKFSDNHKKVHKPKTNNNRKKNTAVKKAPIDNASAGVEEAIEAPCVKKHFYKLGPSDQLETQSESKITTSTSLKSPQIYEKSPTRKIQPTPRSRSSTPSYNSNKRTSVMMDDNDDVSPSSRPRTPQRINSNEQDKPQEWQKRPELDEDERRTVNRETTFEKTKTNTTEPRKSNYIEPNIEWIIVDDDGDYDHDDNDSDSFAPEVVDSKPSVKKTTTKLITNEKNAPLAPQRPTKSNTNPTVITKHNILPKTQTKPNDKSPLKTKPKDSKTSQQTRPQKPLTDSRPSAQSPLKTKPKTTAPSNAPRKTSPKTTTEETLLGKTFKTTQVIKEKTNKLIETEQTKRKPQSPERKKPKAQIHDFEQPNGNKEDETIVVTHVLQTRFPKEKIEQLNESNYEPQKPNNYDEPQTYDTEKGQFVQFEPNYKTRQEINEESNKKTSGKKPEVPEHTKPSYRKPHETDKQPIQSTPGFRAPQGTFDEPIQPTPVYKKPEEISNQRFPTLKEPKGVVDEPSQGEPDLKGSPLISVRKQPSPSFQKLQGTFDVKSPYYRKPEEIYDEPHQDLRKPHDTENESNRDYGYPEQNIDEEISITKLTQKLFPDTKKPYETNTEPNKYKTDEGSYKTYHRQQPNKSLPFENEYKPKDDEPFEIDDDEFVIETECATTTHKEVAKRIQKFETNNLKKSSPTPQKEKQYRTKEILKKLPINPRKETSPSRAQKTPKQAEESKPKPDKLRPEKSSDTTEDETFVNSSELIINSKQQRIISNQTQREGQKSREEPTDKIQKSPKHVSPTRTQLKPGDKKDILRTTVMTKPSIESEPLDTYDDKTIVEITSATQKHVINEKLVQEEILKKGNQPTQTPQAKNVSPTRFQKKPEPMSPSKTFPTSLKTTNTLETQICKEFEDQEYLETKPTSKPLNEDEIFMENKKIIVTKYKPEKPSEERPQSPSKHKSPTRTPKKADQTFRTTLQTTESVIEKPIKKVDDRRKPEEKTPKGFKGYTTQPSDSEPDDITTESSHIITSSSQKQFTTEKNITDIEEPSKYIKPKNPDTGFRTPTREVSPTFKQTTVINKTFTKVGDEKYPDKKTPYKKEVKPDKTSNTDEDEIYAETGEHVKVTETKRTLEFKEPESSKDMSPIIRPQQKPQTTVRTEKKPDQNVLEEPSRRPHSPTKTKSQSIYEDETLDTTVRQTKTITDKITKKVDVEEYPDKKRSFEGPTSKRPQSPTKIQKEPIYKEENFGNNIRSIKIITVKTTDNLYDDEHMDKARPQKKGEKPKEHQPYTDNPLNTDDNRFTETCERSIKQDKDKIFVDTTEVFTKSIHKPKSSLEKHPDEYLPDEKEKNKMRPKDHKARKPNDTDSDDVVETDELEIETSAKHYKTTKNTTVEQKEEKLFTNSKPREPTRNQTIIKPVTSTYVEVTETIEGETCPDDDEQFPVPKKYTDNKKPSSVAHEPNLYKPVSKYTTNINEEFIKTERDYKEIPDGAFISKTVEPSSPTSPKFKKKGAGRRDTFEERCRQILGMETYGDTPGTFKPQPSTEIEEEKTLVTERTKLNREENSKNTGMFQVKIEDCDEDEEEPLSINSVQKTLHKQIHTTEKKIKEESIVPERFETPTSGPKQPENYSTEIVKKSTKTSVHKKAPATNLSDEIKPDLSEPETAEESFEVLTKEAKKSEIKISKKYSSSSPPRAISPNKGASSPRCASPTKTSLPRSQSPVKDTPTKRKPSKDILEPKTQKASPSKPDNDTKTIKDRLRSSTRKSKSPSKPDEIDGSESSPDHSPTRYTERRRSSNISVTTEIIIEHTDSDTPSKIDKKPEAKKPQDSVFKEIINSTVLPEKLTRRLPVTERKESAPVHRVTSKDKDSKMSRSTSENLIKIKKPTPQSLSPKTTAKVTEHRRPNKCFATKSINLSTTDRLVRSEDMENVIIDIQHAKSSREPSPDKIVPTPVPAYLDTGKPRYPDVVQEPEDDQPRRKPQVKNIPIFEEENNSFVGCHITEVNIDRSQKMTTYDSLDYDAKILNNPVIDAPPSLDYPSLEKPVYDESLLTVHEKVSKFQDIVEEKKNVVQHKTKSIFTNEDDDEEFIRNERIHTTRKLAPSVPQKSPDLVRTISKTISRQNESESEDNEPKKDYLLTSHNDDSVECLTNKKISKEFEVSHRQQQRTATETIIKTAEKYQQPEDDHDDDDDELIPHTATHTTIIEERRQKDILSRPSVFENRNKKLTTLATTKTQLKCNKSPVKDAEKLRPDNKSHTKPTSTVTNTVTETAAKGKQTSQRKNSDIDYELRGSVVETGVKNIISKQTKVYNNNSKPNDSKNVTANNKKPEKHMPVHSVPVKNSDYYDLSADDDEMIIAVEGTTDFEAQVVNEDLNKERSKKIPLTSPHKKQTTHSSTDSSTTNRPLNPKTKEHVVILTETSPLKSNTVTSNTTSIKTYERADNIDETVLEATKKKTSTYPSKTTKMSTTTTDSVAARRIMFENNNSSPSGTPTKRTPITGTTSVKKHSYMDHTKSSLEHIRRDSFEINKTNYSRKPSHPEDEVAGIDRDSLVKFEVPQSKFSRATSVVEDINVEEIFDLEILERLLETVQSYEIRRRIRAQIRLIKKNQKNEMVSTTTIKTSKADDEEPDTITKVNKKIKPECKTTNQIETDKTTQKSSTRKEYIFEETYLPPSRRSPKPNSYPYEDEKKPVQKLSRSPSPQSSLCRRNIKHERHNERTEHSPERKQQTEVVREYSSRTSKQQYFYEDNQEHKRQIHEITHETSPSRKSPTHSIHSSPERRQTSPDSHKSVRGSDRSRSPQTKAPQSTRVTTSRSPDTKITSSIVRKSSATHEQQQQETTKSSSTKPQMKSMTKKTTTTTKSKADDKTPVWADRKNILKAPSSTTPNKITSSSNLDSKPGYSKITKSTTSRKTTRNKSAFVDDDCVTSSYGIGPTDENGLPLFGIRALKKKKPMMEPSETTEEVTGYVVEEKYYSDNKTKPIVERKEFIYSTNSEELQKLKDQVEETTTRKAIKDAEAKETRQTALITKGNAALRCSPEDDFLDSTTKYVRRGSVKEMSEKFIQRESSSALTEPKSNTYPKAGLILRTNSRKNSRDVENDNEHFESYKTTQVQHEISSSKLLADFDNVDEHEQYEVEEVGSQHSGRFITESESECDSVKTQRQFKKVTSTSSATRSFLNSQGEEKVITNVSDCLERMRNADNVVEEGDTAEDQEARALLNKFLGASIIMKGVESSLPAAASNRQSRIITTTTTSSNLSDDNDDDNTKHEVKTTRITKTIKSGSSSTPVTYTTCDIEEIWDEEILKELLEQARTYEERRKIRSRLRELMADREETKNSPIGEKESTASANVIEEEESSASEYEEIIEEVTDYDESETEVDNKEQNDKVIVADEKSQYKETTTKAVKTNNEEKSVAVTAISELSSTKQESNTEQILKTTSTKNNPETVEKIVETKTLASKSDDHDKTDSSDKGECIKPMVINKEKTPQTTPHEGSNHSNQTTNSQKLKPLQISSNSCNTTGSQSSQSMQAPSNYNKTYSTGTASSQNPIVTVQTAGRADSDAFKSSINNSYRQTNRNINDISMNNFSSDSNSLGGSNVVVVGSNDSPRQADRLGVPQKEDSGTESGEDLRLIAAGLRDQLQIQSDSNIIEDVTCALSRLENSLKEGKDISVDTEKRKALLALVARLRAGLTSPEKLAEIAAAMSELDGNEGPYGETSSPEADAHRSNRSRFAKRRNRINRHTVGVSREELADARRYMEDMLIMGNISQCTTPEANNVQNNTPPKWYPLEKNASSAAVLTTAVLQRPKQFAPEESSAKSHANKLAANNGKRRPLSGEFSVTFESPRKTEDPRESPSSPKKSSSPEDSSKSSRFSNKKHLMKRANTIDLAKSHKYNPECDTDSDAEDKDPHLGLKRAVQVSVKKRVQNVVPPFEPKTENDRKFLAFINKQSDKPGLGWTTSRSVSNWTNKFGSIKNNFEGGLASKPPQAPHHVPTTTKPYQSSKLFNQPATNNSVAASTSNYVTNQQIAMRLQQEADRQTEERRRKLERNRLEYERRERDKLERQRQQRERQERERAEREHFERKIREQDQIAAAQHAALLRQQGQISQKAATNMNVAKPIPINEFKHAPQSVFRPIDSSETPSKPIYKPIAQIPRNSNNWQSPNALSPRGQGNSLTVTSPSQYSNARPDNSFITSPTPSSRSPIALPWASKPTVDNSAFKSKASRFEERSKYDNVHSSTPYIQRHHSLRSANDNQLLEDLRRRPSLPNAFDPYSVRQLSTQQDPLAYLPPPQNISFTYSDLKPKTTYQSYPCLPLVVGNNHSDYEYKRPLEDSLTDPHSVPLVLTSSNPSYCPPATQQQLSQPRLGKQFGLVSPADSAPSSPSIYNMLQTDCTDDDIDSDTNLLEYHAVSRVMRKPQGQTAVTIGRRTGHVSDDELYGKNSRAAKNLLNTMKSLGNSSSKTKPKAPVLKRQETVTSPRTCLSPDGLSYQAPLVEPLFPEINKFEANRKPIYVDEPKNPIHSQPNQRKQFNMYKSMENIRNQSNTMTTNAPQVLPQPYVGEVKTSYVVTFPTNETTDDEDLSRTDKKKTIPPKSLTLQRQKNVSENSTCSLNTVSTSYNQNLPSPNTSWTSNPIVTDESNSYKNKTVPSPATEQNHQQVLSSQTITSNKNSNYSPSYSDYKKTVSSGHTPLMAAKEQAPVPTSNATAAQLSANKTQQRPMSSSKPLYEVEQNVAQKQTKHKIQNPQNERVQIPNSPNERVQKPPVTQKPTDYINQVSKNVIKPTASNTTTQEKRTLANMRKTVSEDHHYLRAEQSFINPKNSNISEEMLIRLEQQRERISNDAERRKSLGNTLDYQIEKQARIEAQTSQEYKSSAPADTPDIVKSSLPKDESQPILKKFGPPQRHHYMPNSYKGTSVDNSSSSVVSTTTHSSKLQGKTLHSTSNQTVVRTSQQRLNNVRPTVMETPATPQPDDDYIPRNIVYNNIHAFTSMNRRQQDDSGSMAQDHYQAFRPNKLSKSDSWNQIMMLQNQNSSSMAPKLNPSPTNELRRTKSGHTLAFPKMYEAAITKTDVSEKQKTVAAYFSEQKSPIHQETVVEQQTTKRSVINRTKTSEKVSAASRKSTGSTLPIVTTGLQRSATMPHIANINLLDESNVEDAFEQLIMGS